MTNKEIAERLRDMSNRIGSLTQSSLAELADELDPPLPEPGTVVWWQDDEGLGDPTLGQVNEHGCIEMFGTIRELELSEVKWWPARIAGPMQEIVDIPPVSEWPEDSETLTTLFEGEKRALRYRDVITRTEAARREAEE